MYHMHILILIETKITSDRAVKVPQEFGSLYPQSNLAFGNSSGGGIWVFWDPARLQVSKLSGSAQLLLSEHFRQLEMLALSSFQPSTHLRSGDFVEPYGTI